MSDTQQAPQAVIDLSILEGISKEIAALDEQIAAASGSEAAVKNSVMTKIAADNAPQIDQLFTELLPQLASLDVTLLAGFVHRFPDVVAESFGPQIDELVDGKVKALTDNVKENVAPLKERRKDKLDNFKAFQTVLTQLGFDTSSIPEPKRSAGRTSSGGSGNLTPAKVGKNPEGVRYGMDGKDRPPSQNTFSSLAYYATMGCAGTEEAPARWGVEELRAYLSQNGVTEDATTWSVTLPNKTVVSARPLDEVKDKDIFDKVAALGTKDDEDEEEETPETPAAETPAAPTTVDDDGMPVQ